MKTHVLKMNGISLGGIFCLLALGLSYSLSAQNNCPDLIVTELKVISYNGVNIRYAYTIKNIGNIPANLNTGNGIAAGNVSVQAFVSKDTVFNNADDLAAGGTILGENLPDLAVGATTNGSFGATRSFNANIYPYLILKIDWGGTLPECNELNNYKYTSTQGFYPKIDTSSCQYKDSLELVKLYLATNGQNWINKWDLGQPIRNWYGVRVNTEGCVSCLDLDGNFDCIYQDIEKGNGLTGSIPNFYLPSLKILVLGRNAIAGTIPNLYLPNVELFALSYNRLSGSIPLLQIPNIKQLRLDHNQLSGNIPNFNFVNLQYLALQNNLLSGQIPNLSLPKLQYLFLEHNQLSGSLPDLNLPALQFFNLYNNKLTGNIPNFKLPELRSLNLAYNQLSGSIPNFKLLNLHELILANNQLSNTIPNLDLPNLSFFTVHTNQLSGSIPDFKLPKMIQLILASNKLSGNIPVFKMPNLQVLYLGSNQLTGQIPVFESPGLVILDLSDNKLSGMIPNFNLSKLKNLALNLNRLEGSVPKFNLPQLEQLFLSNNLLKGNVPSFDMPKLKLLHLDNNMLQSLPDLSYLPLKKDTLKSIERGLRIQNNKLTFRDIIPNINFTQTATFIYAPQGLVYQDTVILFSPGESLNIDLGIDSNILDNRYNWFKNGQAFRSITGSNKLIFNTVQPKDSGIYTVQIINPRASALSLSSRKIQLKQHLKRVCKDTLVQIDTIICQGQSLKIGDSLFVRPGSYQYTFKTSGGCDSSVILKLEVVSINIGTGPIEFFVCAESQNPIRIPVNREETIDWYTQASGGMPAIRNSPAMIWQNSGHYFAEKRHIASGCTSSNRFEVNYVKYAPQEFRIRVFSCDSTQAGVDTIIYSNAMKCDSVVIRETIYQAPKNKTSLIDTSLCSPAVLTLGSKIYSRTGRYTDTLQTNLGCDSIIEINLRIIEVDLHISGDTSLCPGDTTSIMAKGGLSYQWNTGLRDSVLRVHRVGRYIVTATDINGCQDSADIKVTQDTLPRLLFMGKTRVCSGDSTQIFVTGAKNYRWSSGDTLASVKLKAGIYSIQAQNTSGCAVEVPLSITEIPRPVAANNQVLQVCTNEFPILKVATAKHETIDWYSVERGGVPLDTNKLVFKAPTFGTYFANIRNITNGCSSNTRSRIDVLRDSIKPNFVYCPDTIMAYLEPGQKQVKVDWQHPIAEDNCSGEVVITALNAFPGTFFTLGRHIIQYTASDLQNNMDTCAFIINVIPTHELTIFVDSASVKKLEGNRYTAQVRVLNFKSVRGLQLSLRLRDTGGKIIKAESLANLAGTFNTHLVDDSTLTLVWNENDQASGLDLRDSTAILSLILDLPGNPGDCRYLAFTDEPTEILAVISPQLVIRPTTLGTKVCRPARFKVTGRILKENGTALPKHEVFCADSVKLTDTKGYFGFYWLSAKQNYLLYPFNNRLVSQGLNVIDIALIREHILLRKLLVSPYSIIAADVDGSKSVNVLDISFLRELILQKRNQFPNGINSWVYLPYFYKFQNPRRPLSEAVPKSVAISQLQQDTTIDFIGIKMGDVDLSARAELRSSPTLELLVRDRFLRQGETISIPVRVANRLDLSAYQIEILFDPEALEILGVDEGDLTGMDEEAQGWEEKEKGVITLLWFKSLQEQFAKSSNPETILFHVRIRAKGNAYLSKALLFGSRDNNALAVDKNMNVFVVESHFEPINLSTAVQEVYQQPDFSLIGVYPNPFHQAQATTLVVNAAKAEDIYLRIFNAAGQKVFSKTLQAHTGRNVWDLDAHLFPSKGIYLFHLSGKGTAVGGKLIFE